jgi:hypothetical protein
MNALKRYSSKYALIVQSVVLRVTDMVLKYCLYATVKNKKKTDRQAQNVYQEIVRFFALRKCG